MKRYRYLGYGTTNSNGVAHLDHDPQGNPINGYTGTGAGEIDVVASLDNPIIDDSIVSEPYPVFDCPVYDGDNTPVSINFSKTNNAVVTDEVVSLIASVLNMNNNPCINIPVVFKQGNTVLGTAYTDCTGDATITQIWEDSDIFDVTATVGENLSEDITMFVKDNKNLFSYNIFSGSDYLKNVSDVTCRQQGQKIVSSDEWSFTGNRSFKITLEGDAFQWCLFPVYNFDGTNISISLKVYCPNGSCDIWLVEVKNDSLKKSSVRAPSEHTVQTIELTRNLEFENPDYIGIRVNLLNVGDIVFVDDLSLTTQ